MELSPKSLLEQPVSHNVALNSLAGQRPKYVNPLKWLHVKRLAGKSSHSKLVSVDADAEP